MRDPRPLDTAHAFERALVRLPVAVLAALTLGCAPEQGALPAADPAEKAREPGDINWSPCYRDLGEFECGTVRVPLDYVDPANDGKISIALVRAPASDPEHRIGSLFINPGGPGSSGIEAVAYWGAEWIFGAAHDDVLARFDLVGFDPRGVGRSSGVRCWESPPKLTQLWEGIEEDYYPVTPEDEARWAQTDQDLITACEHERLVEHISTANVARDLDILREAVGDEQLNLYGVSWGSFLGQTYANMFPDRVRAVVIDGIIDPVAYTTGYGDAAATVPAILRIGGHRGARDTLDEYFRLCEEYPDGCPMSGGAAARFDAITERLRGGDLLVQPSEGEAWMLSLDEWIGTTHGALYVPWVWPELADFMAAVESGIADVVDAAAKGLSAGLDSHRYAHPGGYWMNYYDAQVGFYGSDLDDPTTYEDFAAGVDVADEEARDFARAVGWWSSITIPYPGPSPDRYAGPFDVEPATPLLVVSMRHDPITPYENAVAVAAMSPGARLVTLEAGGHASWNTASKCAERAIADYLLTATPPAADLVCPVDYVPFAE